MKVILRSAALAAAASLCGCSVGTNEAEPVSPSTPPVSESAIHVVLGPASESRLTISTFDANVRSRGTTAKYSADVDTVVDGETRRLKTIDAGRMVGKTTLSQNNVNTLDDKTAVIVSVTMGRDTDPNDDGVISTTEGLTGPEILGQIEAVTEASQVKGGKIIINLLTTLAAAGRAGITDGELAIKRADQFAVAILKAGTAGDLNADGKISHLDLLKFDPSLHEQVDGQSVRVHDKFLKAPRLYALWVDTSAAMSVVGRIHAGGETNTASRIAIDLFGDSNANGLANLFEDASTNDTDADGTPDATDSDLDGDGLSNEAEDSMGLNPYSRDTDGDGLADGSEVNTLRTDPLLRDTDGDGLADGVEINSARTDPLKVDTDADGLADGMEVNGFMLFDGTVVRTNPTDVDTDRDRLNDALEKQVQDQFAAYADNNSAASLLRAGLNPANPDAPAQMGTLDYSSVSFSAAVLEADPDGDGKPSIEELARGTNPSDRASSFLYIYETAAGSRTPRFSALEGAGFVYVPGGWDVDDDGVIEPGFFLSAFEAKAAAEAVPTSRLPTLLAGAAVYSPTSRLFGERLCSRLNGGDGTDAGTSDTGGNCRGNSYTDLEIGTGVTKVVSTASGSPYTLLSWAEARVALLGSPVDAGGTGGGPYSLDLPSEKQWMQAVGLAVNNGQNWTGGAVDSGRLVSGHSDNQPANALPVTTTSNPFDSTGNTAENGANQRRTLVLANGVRARDFEVPLGYSAVVWDLAGNAAEWTGGAFAAKASTSETKARAGGDRFIDGLTAPLDYLGIRVSQPSPVSLDAMPAWLKPRTPTKTLGFTSGAGYYLDGSAASDQNSDGQSDGARASLNYGYGSNGFGDGFAFPLRGGDFRGADFTGVSTLDLQNGPGYRSSDVGFRAAAAAR